MKLNRIVPIAVLSLILGPYALPEAQKEGQVENQHQVKQQDKPEKQAKPEKQQHTQHANPQQQRPQPREAQHKQPPAAAEQRQSHDDRQHERRSQQQPQLGPTMQPPQQHAQPPRVQERSNGTVQTSSATQPPPRDRLSQQRQQQLVAKQQQRLTQYRQHLDRQQAVVQAQTAQLRQQNRMAQYRFQEGYRERLRQQELFLRNGRHPDYDRDPYFYTAPIYRYRRGGRFYETNEYGADFLRQAVNYGYEEGYRAAEADREDGWRSNYRDSYAYRDANYGYNGYYVDRGDYNYYFREGFRRGYEDGYNSHFQYGRYTNGSYSLLDAILSQILGFQRLR